MYLSLRSRLSPVYIQMDQLCSYSSLLLVLRAIQIIYISTSQQCMLLPTTLAHFLSIICFAPSSDIFPADFSYSHGFIIHFPVKKLKNSSPSKRYPEAKRRQGINKNSSCYPSLCEVLNKIALCAIGRVTISSFIAIIVGAIISMKIADWSPRRNQEPQFPPLMSTTTGGWGRLALSSFNITNAVANRR